MRRPAASPQRGDDRHDVVIELSHVTKEYASGAHLCPALVDVSFSIRESEILAVQGPTGAGKTTLLRVIAGHTPPTAGEVTVLGSRLERAPAETIRNLLHGRVTSVFETSDLVESLTCHDNITVTLAHALSPQARRSDVLTVLASVGLEHRADALVAALSSGERQRLAIAHALATDPRIVVVDEPGRHLDWRGAERIVDRLVRTRDVTRTTIVLATTDLRTAVRADRAILLRDGVVRDEIRTAADPFRA